MATPEQRIKEQRMIEATRKGYMGLNGKLGVILCYMGQPIKGHHSPLYEVSYLDTPYPEDDEEIGYFEEEELVSDVGYVFDGLSRGVHLEIKYIDNVLSVSYKGFNVYIESSGDLECFVPHPDWEQHIDRFYVIAAKLQREDKRIIRIDNSEKKEAKHKGWLQEMWRKWGFKL